MDRPSSGRWAAIAALVNVSILQIVHGEALAQISQPPAQPVAPVPVLSVSPNTGGSTLDQLRSPKSDQLELQFPSGFTCRAGGGDTPAFIVYGDSGQLVAPVTGISGVRAGVALIVPLYKARRDVCDRPMQLQNALSELELAEKLVTAGAMTNEQYMKVADRVKKMIFGI